MGIPIVDEVLSSIWNAMKFFISSAPKPMKFLFFLVFVLIFSLLFSFFLHIVGIHCNTNKEVVKMSSVDFIDNVQVVFLDKYTQINSTAYYPDFMSSDDFVEHCLYAYKNESGDLKLCNTTNVTSIEELKTKENCSFFLKIENVYDNTINCTYIDIFDCPDGLSSCVYMRDLCVDDAYRNNETLGWFDRYFFSVGALDCRPPEHYFWNSTTGKYQCLDLDYCGINVTSNTELDNFLKQHNAELWYAPNIADKSYKKAIQLKCDNQLRPTLTLYGLPIFSYQLWLVLIVISVLFYFLHKIRKD